MIDKPIIEYVKRITDPASDMVCSTRMTCGETLTILKQAKRTLEFYIANLEETVERQTGEVKRQKRNRRK